MNISRTRLLVVAAMALAGSSYMAYKIGHMQASRNGLETLAYVCLWSVKPSIQLIELATANPASIPERIQVNADGSILMVARYAMASGPRFMELPDEAKNTLCSIAKNRELYRKRSPGLYDDALMSYLAEVHTALKDAKLDCRV